MTLAELLSERKAVLCGRWLDAVLAEYGEVTAARWRREKDPFANPVGHALAQGLPELFDAVLRGGEPGTAAVAALEEIVRHRAVQPIGPARAVGFPWLLRDEIRRELAGGEGGASRAAELEAVERRIEALVLRAFELYVALREQVFRIRQEELKRSVASILRRWHEAPPPDPLPALRAEWGSSTPEPEALSRLTPPRDPAARR